MHQKSRIKLIFTIVILLLALVILFFRASGSVRQSGQVVPPITEQPSPVPADEVPVTVPADIPIVEPSAGAEEDETIVIGPDSLDIQTEIDAQETTDIPPEFEEQLTDVSDELPEDLQKQLEEGPVDLPPDLQEQIDAPLPEIPDDIKEALETTPQEITIEEVNGPADPNEASGPK